MNEAPFASPSEVTRLLELIGREGNLADFLRAFRSYVSGKFSGSCECHVWLFDNRIDAFTRWSDPDSHPDSLLPSNKEAVRRLLSVDGHLVVFETGLASLPNGPGLPTLACILSLESHTYGILEVNCDAREPSDLPITAMEALAAAATLGIRNFIRRSRRMQLAQAHESIGRQDTVEGVLEEVKKAATTLVDCDRVGVARIKPETRELEFTHTKDGSQFRLEGGPDARGLTWQVIREKTSILTGDVRRTHPLVFEPFWQDTCSELAVPIKATVEVWHGYRREASEVIVGVINVESPARDAFTTFDRDTLEALAGPAALMILRLGTEEKLQGWRKTVGELAHKTARTEILSVVARGVLEALSFDHLNISLVNSDTREIATVIVTGPFWSGDDQKDRKDRFKQEAKHSLDSRDIQAEIVRERKTYVPSPDCPLFDANIHEKYRLNELVRVYVPMIAALDGRLVGTIEAGYRNTHLPQIFARDVEILRQFADYATAALDQARHKEIEKITHELRTHAVGIRNNADFLELNFDRLRKHTQKQKLGDILTDVYVLFSQIGNLGHLFGGRAYRSTTRRTFLMRDVVFKTLYQSVPFLRDKQIKFNEQVFFDPRDEYKIDVWVDRDALNQVFSNLISNSIKYSGDPAKFYLKIQLEDRPGAFAIMVMDNGIGIDPGEEEKIFEEGYRSPKVIGISNVSGSGVGLSIARARIRELGGEVRVKQNSSPTTFEVLVPKTLANAPRSKL